MPKTISCRLCSNDAAFSFQKKILGKYRVGYFLCSKCNSLQTEEPYWLEEAYQPINEQLDTGQFIRSLHNAAFLNAIYTHLNLGAGPLLDYGCGSGLTARILRDVGINAYGYDAHSTPRLLMGFQRDNLDEAKLINLCEVAEHFPYPQVSFEHIFSCNPQIVVVQTELFSKIDEQWGYLSPEHGQHIFFYSEESIAQIAKTHRMGATFIQGFTVFFKVELLDSLFIESTSRLREELVMKIRQSVLNLLNQLLSNGYKYAIQDNQILSSIMNKANQ